MYRYSYFNGTYGVTEKRKSIVNYIQDNQNIFENHVDGDFNEYWYKMELDKACGTYTELLAFYTILEIEIDIDVYDNIQWAKPLTSIKRTQTKENFINIYEMVSLNEKKLNWNKIIIIIKNKMIKHQQNRTRGVFSVLVFPVPAGPSDASL